MRNLVTKLDEFKVHYKKPLRDFSYLLLRITIGILLLVHGFEKIFRDGIDGTIEGFKHIDRLPIPTFCAYYACFTQFIGGILLIIGLATSLVAFLNAITFVFAIFTVHIQHGLLDSSGGVELCLLYLVILVVLCLSNKRIFSLDQYLIKQ